MHNLKKFPELQRLQANLHKHPIYGAVQGQANMIIFM